MSKVVNGRKSVAERALPSITDDIFGNRLALSDEIQKELKKRGYEGRWVNFKKLLDNQGHHERGWVAYKREKSDTMDSSTFLGGSDPDGYIRRGDAILAVKSVAQVEQHRDFLRAKADRQQGYNKEKAAELQAIARDAGMKSRVEDGLDSDEE